jgi:hypothetical protein
LCRFCEIAIAGQGREDRADKRTTSGSWRLAKDYPNFPANVCKVVGGTTVHWGGCSLLIQDHELRAKDVHGDIV